MINLTQVPEIRQMLEEIESTQGDWNGRCNETSCYWNMWDAEMLGGRYNGENYKICVSESLVDLKMEPNSKGCLGYSSKYQSRRLKMKNKGLLIGAGIGVMFVIMIAVIFVSTNNKAINLEEQIHSATASIEVQEKRRIDLVYNLVDTVEQYAKHETDTLKEVVSARQQANTGNIEDAKMVLNAIVEQYPDLKADDNYKQLMTEIALTENMIAEHRNNYNQQIRSYNKFVRKFPTSSILGMMGYERVDFTYTEYNAPTDAPTDLFNRE